VNLLKPILEGCKQFRNQGNNIEVEVKGKKNRNKIKFISMEAMLLDKKYNK
jgi:hypothetical protein